MPLSPTPPGVGVNPLRIGSSQPNPNLLLWSEEFQQAAWTKTGVTVTADQVNDPNGELTADLVDANDILAARIDQAAPGAPVAGLTYTLSVYFKAGPDSLGGAGTLALVDDAGGSNVAAIESSLATEWLRVAVSIEAQPGATALTCRIRPDEDDGKSLYVWGAKLEEGPVATAYVKREGT